jgi:hypothetical protein
MLSLTMTERKQDINDFVNENYTLNADARQYDNTKLHLTPTQTSVQNHMMKIW